MENEFIVKGLLEDLNLSKKIYNLVNNKKILEIGGPTNNNYWIPKFYKISKDITIINLENENNISLNTGCASSKSSDKLKILNCNNVEEFISNHDSTYDIIISSHTVEHIANPIKILKLWKKLLNSNGIMIHILPEKSRTSDYLRPITMFKKLKLKYINKTDEDDNSEIPEILQYIGNCCTWNKNILLTEEEISTQKEQLMYYFNNPSIIKKTRPLHHHVYDFSLLSELSNFIGMDQFLEFNIYIDNWVFWKLKI